MKSICVALPLCILLMISSHASRASQTDAAHPALTWSDNPELSGLFTQAGVDGTFVLYDTTTGHITYHNKERAGTRFIPASTFKIPNSLIGLSTGAVGDVEELLPYGGKPQYLKVWEQDMGLRDAIRVSNVPVYQELARRIGLERMRKHLVLLDYGNHDAGNVVDRFWLEGPLQISAYEQAIFLGRLARRELPLSAEIQRHVAEIVETDRGDEWVLYAKTGWAVTPMPDLGWWVGWVVKNDTVFSFALNIDLVDKADVAKRIELGRASLELLGIIQ